jgi:hypothetical protein
MAADEHDHTTARTEHHEHEEHVTGAQRRPHHRIQGRLHPSKSPWTSSARPASSSSTRITSPSRSARSHHRHRRPALRPHQNRLCQRQGKGRQCPHRRQALPTGAHVPGNPHHHNQRRRQTGHRALRVAPALSHTSPAPFPIHPWVDSAVGAAVRFSMSVAVPGKADGILDKAVIGAYGWRDLSFPPPGSISHHPGMRKTLICLCLATLPLHADTDTFRERFADPATRSQALAELVPGTRNFYFHTALDHQLAGRAQEFSKTLAEWQAAAERPKKAAFHRRARRAGKPPTAHRLSEQSRSLAGRADPPARPALRSHAAGRRSRRGEPADAA